MTIEWTREGFNPPSWWDALLMTELMNEFIELLEAKGFERRDVLFVKPSLHEIESYFIVATDKELADVRQTFFTSMYKPFLNNSRKINKSEAIALGAQGVFDYLMEEVEPDTSHLNSWREMITEELVEYDETWEDIESITLSGEELDKRFDANEYHIRGIPFTAWTSKNVYFSHEYDGQESVMAVPRHPSSDWVITYPD